MDVFPESPDRNWSELPLDALSAIFAKLGVIEILMGPGLVCRSWLAAAKAPELWRSVDMTHQDVVFSKGPDVLCSMAKVMIDRSDGLMESFWALKFATCGLVDYMAGRANSLKSIQLIRCTQFWDVSLARLASKCPILEEIECSYQRLPANLFRYIGTKCLHLKCLRIHTQWLDFDPSRDLIEMENQGYENEGRRIPGESHASWEARQNENAFAIAETMHELRLLQMGGNSLTDKGVHAILKGCSRLKFFDISKCYNVSDGLRVRCTKIKHVWLPGQRPIALSPDRHVTEENEGNDNGLMLHDLWEAEVQPLRGKAAMDDYAYDDNHWKEYWSPLLMLPQVAQGDI
ncbi:hypothetical protein HU200_056100 [Digitaria exilis]|uniref:F-box domain-containing protein n=1 Tax=Digitaria exilis TaxID=1010633 RepID=A0A835E415_9POAL|nr:hypothetical protein HU200_056100 [Digitaria exilis]